MNRKILILFCIFILSRVLFINPLPVFFDSPEYLQRLSNPNYFQAIASGHIPFHIAYITLYWPIFHFFTFLSINPAFAVIFAQVLFSAIAIYCFYCLIEIIANKKVAFISTIIGISFPLYWITNVSIMPESTCVNFFLISLFFLASYAKREARLTTFLLIGCIFFGLSLLTHPLVILWLPLVLSLVYFFRKERITSVFSAIVLTTVLTILINGLFVANYLHISFPSGIHKYLFGEVNIIPDVSSFLMILRFFRNAFIPVLQNNTLFILLLTIISLIKIFKINKKLFIVVILWIFPFFIVNQWFNPLLSGRHAIIAEFGFAFLVAKLLEKKRELFFITLAYLLVVFLPALALLKQPIPYLTERKFFQTLPKGLLIESHFARPQVEGSYSGKIIFVNQPGWDKKNLEKSIDSYLSSKKSIFITSQALSDPYGLYSGPFFLPLSLSYAKKFELGDVITSYSLKKYATISKDAELILYEIMSKKKSQYPNIPILKCNRHQINYFDPVIQLWFFIERARIIQIQSIIKE